MSEQTPHSPSQSMERRTFLKLLGAAAIVTASQDAVAAQPQRISLIVDRESPLTASEPVTWAVKRLQHALAEKGIAAVFDATNQVSPAFPIVVAPPASRYARSFSALPHLAAPETTALIPGEFSGSPAILVSAVDTRGFVYGLLELVERVDFDADPFTALHLPSAIVESTSNRVRSVQRAFLSEIEDKSWYYHRSFWTTYLDNLAAARFNRFNFAYGFGYDFPRGVTGDYFHFPYPYLVEVPSYPEVRVDPPLAAGERQRNLETLQFIAAETARRGLEFQLGIWTHAYAWTDSPHSDHHILGLTPATHAQYCHDALAMILKLCPQISGLTLRIHGESGIPEGSYDFWQKVYDAIAAAGRPVEIDMHAKGINQIMIDMARKTGMPVKVSPKYAAEHMGLSYHQADIRTQEIPRAGAAESGVFSVSNGERRFTRYSYADLYQQNSGFEILYRLWPGTQRHLLWADPALAAGFGRTANFCGAAGLEICEPLTFKGREGSGHPGGRNAYLDKSLAPAGLESGKFEMSYLLWGRMLYNPEAAPETWRRDLRRTFGAAAAPIETAIAQSSRVLPLVTSAYLPSASNHSYWPEMYVNMPVIADSERSPYTDTDKPFCVATCSPLDPQLFSSVGGHAKDLLAGTLNPRYSPIEVAQWLEDFVSASGKALDDARASAGSRASSAEWRRMEEDVLILNGLGNFFAGLFRSGVLYSIFEESGDPEAGKLALIYYKKARSAWASMAERARSVYVSDVSYGDIPQRRGHWIDRIPAIDTDIAAMEKKVAEKHPDAGSAAAAIRIATRAVTSPGMRPSVVCAHAPAAGFHPGNDLPITVAIPSPAVTAVTLWYRHVNQGERWKSTTMEHTAGRYHAAIPGSYTGSPYPLQYYFELRSGESAWLFPTFDATLSNQPYYAVYKRL